ncbi:GNAT family N-acetyltransferase [Devosia sp.]|uniref:GNAT family N-acetyltransferase n=1 Tax=Devosia sp. TaxID=1871048 RepID=UPI0035B4C7D1
MIDATQLDNPVWSALCSGQAHMARVNGLARRYAPEVTPLAGLREMSPRAFSDLRAMTETGEVVGLVNAAPFAVPSGWTVMREIVIAQMLCTLAPPSTAEGFVELAEGDVPDMVEIVAATEPGPFRPGTIGMGRFIGYRSPEGRLMAMAGERMRLDGATEISAVCTWPEFRGRGLARSLVTRLAADIHAQGRLPFLHVKTDNAARQLYESLGFAVRGPVHFKVLAAA